MLLVKEDALKIKYGIIYKIINKVNGKIYIGQTTKNKGFDERYSYNFEKYVHNSYLKNSINKYGIDNFEIIKEFDIAYSKEELDDKEKYWINYYNSTNRNYGYNREYGGSNGIPTEEAKKKMSEVKKGKYLGKDNPNYGNGDKIRGNKNPFYGKTHSEEFKKKNSERKKGNKNFLGRHHSDESKRKLAKSHNKKIICITTNEIFDSITIACKKYNLDISSVSKVCKDKQKSSGLSTNGLPLVWQFYDDYLNNKKPIEIKRDNSKIVICLNNYKIFNSATDAGKYVNRSNSNIIACINGKSNYCGIDPETGEPLKWMYYEDYLKEVV